MKRAMLAAIAGLMLAAAAPDPAERLPEPAAEARARDLFAEIRCVVCQNESIDASDADLAGDLRRIVREQVAAGRTDAEVKRFLVDRYGEFVLLRPTLAPSNWLLWAAPFVIVCSGLLLFTLSSRRAPTQAVALSSEEERRLREIVTAPVLQARPSQSGSCATSTDAMT